MFICILTHTYIYRGIFHSNSIRFVRTRSNATGPSTQNNMFCIQTKNYVRGFSEMRNNYYTVQIWFAYRNCELKKLFRNMTGERLCRRVENRKLNLLQLGRFQLAIRMIFLLGLVRENNNGNPINNSVVGKSASCENRFSARKHAGCPSGFR